MIYSSLFMRFAWCVKPRNYILLACHFGNALVQTLQLSRTFSVSLGIIGTATLSTGISFFGALSATLVSFALLKSWQRRRGLPIEESERDRCDGCVNSSLIQALISARIPARARGRCCGG